MSVDTRRSAAAASMMRSKISGGNSMVGEGYYGSEQECSRQVTSLAAEDETPLRLFWVGRTTKIPFLCLRSFIYFLTLEEKKLHRRF